MSGTYEETRLPSYEVRQRNVSAINDTLIRAQEVGMIRQHDRAMYVDIPLVKERIPIEKEIRRKGVQPAFFATKLRVKKHLGEDDEIRYSLTYVDTASHDGAEFYLGKDELLFPAPDMPVRRRNERFMGFEHSLSHTTDILTSNDEQGVLYDLILAQAQLERVAASKAAGGVAIRQAA